MDMQEQRVEKIRNATLKRDVQELKVLAKEYLREVAHVEQGTVEKIWKILEEQEGIDFIAASHFSVLDAHDKEEQEGLLGEVCTALEAPFMAAARKAEMDKETFLRALRPFLMQVRHQIMFPHTASPEDQLPVLESLDTKSKEFKGNIKDEDKMQQLVWESAMKDPALTHVVFRAKDATSSTTKEDIQRNTGVLPGKIFAEYVKDGQIKWEPIFPNALKLQLKIHSEVYEIPSAMVPYVKKTMHSVFEILKGNNNKVFWDQCAPSSVDLKVLQDYTSCPEISPQICTHTTMTKEYLMEQGSGLPCLVVSSPEQLLEETASADVAVFVKAMPHTHDYDQLFQKAMDTQKGIHYCEYLPLFSFLRVQDYTTTVDKLEMAKVSRIEEDDQMLYSKLVQEVDEVLDSLIAHVLYLQEHFKKIEQLVEKEGGYVKILNKTTKLQKKQTKEGKILHEPLLYVTNVEPVLFPEEFTSYSSREYLSCLLYDMGSAFVCFQKTVLYDSVCKVGGAIFGQPHMSPSFILGNVIPYMNSRLNKDILQTIEDMKAEKIKTMGLTHL